LRKTSHHQCAADPGKNNSKYIHDGSLLPFNKSWTFHALSID
jgi:hypothetical protein